MNNDIFPILYLDNELIELCRDWHSGQTSSMYSILSTGTIHNADILRGLASELRSATRSAFETVNPWLQWAENLENSLDNGE